MKTTREEKRMEAVARMEQLGLLKSTIRIFQDYKMVPKFRDGDWSFRSYRRPNEHMIDAFEKEYDALVYAVINTPLKGGGMHRALLFVSDEQEEWVMDRADIFANTIMAYVCNIDAPECSEFGSIGIENIDGCLVRTW